MKAEQVLEEYHQGIRTFGNRNLIGQSFKWQNLSQADFRGSKLQKANFAGAELQGANFQGIKLQGANFEDAKLQGANFEGSRLQGVDFKGAQLQGANFDNAQTGLSFIGKILEIINSLIHSLLLVVVMPIIISSLMQKLLANSLQENIYNSAQQFLFFATATLFIGFLITSLGKGITEALYFVGLITTAVVLTLFSQPVLLTIAWLLVILSIIIANKSLFVYPNKFIAILISVVISILGLYLFVLLSETSYPIENLVQLVTTIYFDLLVIVAVAITFIKVNVLGITRFRILNTIIALLIVFLYPMIILKSIGFEIISNGINYNLHISPLVNSLIPPITIEQLYSINNWQVFSNFDWTIIPGGHLLEPIKVIGILQTILEKLDNKGTINILGCLEYIFIIITGIYFGFCALRDDSRFILLRDIGLNSPVWGQTNFEGANLTGASFRSADLQHTDFSEANLTYVDWFNAQRLNQIKVGTTYLRYPEIRRLVVGKSGEKKVFESLELSGIKLTNARLQHASFIKTNLADADLREANLSNTRLVESNFEGAILSEAILTGAYIENCYISRASQLDNIKCDFLYQRQSLIGNFNQVYQSQTSNKTSFAKFKKKWLRDTIELEFLYNIFNQIYSIDDKIIR